MDRALGPERSADNVSLSSTAGVPRMHPLSMSVVPPDCRHNYCAADAFCLVLEAGFASFASAFVRLAAGITKADVGITASDASPNMSEIAAFGCEAAITRSSRRSAS